MEYVLNDHFLTENKDVFQKFLVSTSRLFKKNSTIVIINLIVVYFVLISKKDVSSKALKMPPWG